MAKQNLVFSFIIKSLFALLWLIPAVLWAQNKKENLAGPLTFYYEMQYSAAGDTLQSDYRETFLLHVNGRNSLFASEKTVRQDSVKAAQLIAFRQGARSFSMQGVPSSAFSYYITKEDLTAPVVVYDQIGGKHFKYDEVETADWQITGAQKIFHGQSCQQAIARQFGRTWIAWFAPQIPLSDGPYKFRGLPGLIVEVYDEALQYRFKLTKFDPALTTVISIPEFRKYKIAHTNRTQFLKARQSYRENLPELARTLGLQISEERVRQLRENAKKKVIPLELD